LQIIIKTGRTFNTFFQEKIVRDKRDALTSALKLYQVNRLRSTYSDLLASKEYGKLGEFFFTDIYGPEDYSRRNNAFKKLSYFLKDAMGERIWTGVEKLIELNDLSEALDSRLLDELLSMGVSTNITQGDYEAAYRNCNNYDLRVRQIDFMVTSTAFMHEMSRIRAIGWIIRGVRLAAFFIGVGDVMKFLERGYKAFSSTAKIDKFNETIKEREMAILDHIYLNHKDRKAQSL
jgi:hypothetical protein